MLTRRQKQCFDFIVAYKAKHGITPSYREIADAMGIKSLSGIHFIISGLVQRGVIIKRPRMARAIEIIRHDV